MKCNEAEVSTKVPCLTGLSHTNVQNSQFLHANAYKTCATETAGIEYTYSIIMHHVNTCKTSTTVINFYGRMVLLRVDLQLTQRTEECYRMGRKDCNREIKLKFLSTIDIEVLKTFANT